MLNKNKFMICFLKKKLILPNELKPCLHKYFFNSSNVFISIDNKLAKS